MQMRVQGQEPLGKVELTYGMGWFSEQVKEGSGLSKIVPTGLAGS